MIRLHLFPPVNSLQPSPPCYKVEAYLTLAGLPFERAESWDLAKAPKGKFPFIEDDGKAIPDSWFIIRYLKRTYGDPLDGSLTVGQRMLAHTLGRVMDESLYYTLSYARWLEDDGFALTRKAFFGNLPPAEEAEAAESVREIARNMLHCQGYGRHSAAEIREIIAADLDALETAMGRRPYLLGDTVTSTDAGGVAILDCMLRGPAAPWLAESVASRPALTAYVARMREQLGTA